MDRGIRRLNQQMSPRRADGDFDEAANALDSVIEELQETSVRIDDPPRPPPHLVATNRPMVPPSRNVKTAATAQPPSSIVAAFKTGGRGVVSEHTNTNPFATINNERLAPSRVESIGQRFESRVQPSQRGLVSGARRGGRDTRDVEAAYSEIVDVNSNHVSRGFDCVHPKVFDHLQNRPFSHGRRKRGSSLILCNFEVTFLSVLSCGLMDAGPIVFCVDDPLCVSLKIDIE